MSRVTQHHPRELRGLKTAFRVLVDQVGGMEAAAAALGYPASRISEAASPNNEERWPRIDHVAELEALAGRPVVTQRMAQMAGCALAPMAARAGSPVEALVSVVSDACRVVSSAAEAMGDGRISEAEAARLRDELATLAIQVDRTRVLLATQAASLTVVARRA